MRIRALIAVVVHRVRDRWSSPRPRPCRTPRTARTKFAKECIEKLEAGDTVDDCQKAPNPLLPATTRVIWGSLAFFVLLVLSCGSSACPAVKNMEKAREDRIRNDLEGAEKARTEAEAEKAQYRAQIADARDEAGRIIEEARQAAEQVRARSHRPGRGRGGRDPRAGPGRHRDPARAARWPSCGPTCRDLVDRARRAHRRAQPRPRHAARSSSTASSTRSGATDRWHGRSHRGVRAGAARDRRRPRATSTRSRTSCSASRASSRATTSCAWRSSNPGHAGRPARRRSSTSCSRTARCRSRVRSRRSSSAPGAVTTCPRSSTGSSSSRRRVASTRSPRCARRSPLDDAQQAAARRGARRRRPASRSR